MLSHGWWSEKRSLLRGYVDRDLNEENGGAMLRSGGGGGGVAGRARSRVRELATPRPCCGKHAACPGNSRARGPSV